MLCYAMLCYAMLCYAMLCSAVQCSAAVRRALTGGPCGAKARLRTAGPIAVAGRQAYLVQRRVPRVVQQAKVLEPQQSSRVATPHVAMLRS